MRSKVFFLPPRNLFLQDEVEEYKLGLEELEEGSQGEMEESREFLQRLETGLTSQHRGGSY